MGIPILREVNSKLFYSQTIYVGYDDKQDHVELTSTDVSSDQQRQMGDAVSIMSMVRRSVT